MHNTLHHYYLDEMGIERWVLKQPEPLTMLKNLADEVALCTKCELHKSRTNTVFFRGNPKASLMIIGEAPGYYEDLQGEPFVGKAGQLLNKMLISVGLNAEDTYICNILKCRPPNNRDPRPEEITACSTYLQQQIKVIEPKIILALGRFAGQFLLNESWTMAKMRENIHQTKHLKINCENVIITYHPAYLLRNPKDKKKTYQDLIKVKTILDSI